jgi:hypothetical protein
VRIALLAALLTLVLAAPAGADTTVHLGMQGNGVVVDEADEPFSCAPSFDESDTVECVTFAVPGTTAVRMRAVEPAEPAGHWVFDRWDGTGCASSAVTGEPKEVCVVGGPVGDADVSPVAVFTDVKGPTIETVTETRSGARGSTVRFDFTADEDASHGATFSCQLGGQAPADCSTGTMTYADMAPGSYELVVSGTDASGQAGPTVGRQFTVNPPPTGETPGPPVVLAPPVFPPVPRILGPNAVTAKVSARRRLSLRKVRLVCPAVASPCAGAVALKGRLRKGGARVTLARKAVKLRPSSTAGVRLRLTRKAARALTERRRLTAKAALTLRAPDVTTRKEIAVTLRSGSRRSG